MNDNNFIAELKRWYKTGGAHVQLLMINAVVFLAVGIIEVFARLSASGGDMIVKYFVNEWFGLQTNLSGFITHPWGAFSYMFLHNGFWHFGMNMVFLYFAGQMFLQFFSQQRLVATYILGGLFGAGLEIISTILFPAVQTGSLVVGASGSIMAIFIALAFYRPQLQVNLFGILPVRLIILAILFLAKDLFSLGTADNTAHFAHLGGAILGIISVQNTFSNKNILERSIRFWNGIYSGFRSLFEKKKMKVVSRNEKGRPVSDEEYNQAAKARQEIIDGILDKISKSGYDSLSKKEKEILFKQSQK